MFKLLTLERNGLLYWPKMYVLKMCQKIGPGPSAHPHLDKIQKKALFSQENIYSEKLRPVNSWLLHFHLCMSGKFSPSSWPFTSDEDQSRKNPGGDSQSCRCLWLDEGKCSGQLQHVRLLPAFSSTMSAWRCIARQVNLGLQTRAHNLCHDNRQLIVIAINRNHSASKINCN